MNKKTDFLTAKQVSKCLSIPLRTIHRLSKQGKIKSIKIGGRWFYKKSQIEEYLLFGTDFRSLPVTRNEELPERRAYPRMNCQIECDYSIDLSQKDGFRKAVITNISGGGLLLKDSLDIVSVEDPVSIRFILYSEPESKMGIETKARIVRKTESGFAVKFRNIDENFQDSIIRYVG